MENCTTTLLTYLLVMVMTGIPFSAEWPMHRGNSKRTGFYDDAAGFPKSSPLWTARLGGAIVSSPAVQSGFVYVGCRDSALYCLDTASGKTVWKNRTAGWVDASPLVDNGTVIVGSRDGSVYVFDSRTGDLLKRFTTGGIQLSSAALLSDGTIVCGMGPPDTGIVAFNRSLGSGPSPAWRVPFATLTYSTPAFCNNRILIGASNGMLYGISASGKKIMWGLPTDGGVYLSSPAIDGALAYFAPGNYDRNVYAVNPHDGRFHWKSQGSPPASGINKKTGTELDPNTAVHILRLSPGDRINAAGTLAASGIDVPDILITGTAQKASSTPDEFFPFGDMKTSSVAVDPENVYVVQKELGFPTPRFNLVTLDKYSGKERWRYRELRDAEPLGYCSSPVVTRTAVFAGWGEGHLYAFDPKTGARLWQDTLQGHIISSPAIADARLYVATMDGYLYCYELTQTPPADNFAEGTFCYPNPARKGVSHIQVYVPRDAALDMTVYNIAERPVLRETKRLSADEKYTYDWIMRNVANGIYFARIVVKYNDGGTEKKVLKIAVLK
jgi:outer membrane protein assembly factor BamB